MKNLYKKVSAVALAGLVLIGGIASSGINSFAFSNKNISERSFMGKPNKPVVNPNEFIGSSEQFLDDYDKIMEDVSEKDIEEIKKVNKILDKNRKDAPFKLGYVPLPNGVLEKLEKEGYSFDYLSGCFRSSYSAMMGLFSDRRFYKKNYVLKFKENNKIYMYIFYIDRK